MYGSKVFGRKALAEEQPNRDRRVKVSTGDMADGIGHCEHRQPECQGDAGETNAELRERGCQHGASAAPEN
jgi:hypothetical protein